MGQRLSRAQAKIAAAGIPFAVPEPEAWAERLDSCPDGDLPDLQRGLFRQRGRWTLARRSVRRGDLSGDLLNGPETRRGRGRGTAGAAAADPCPEPGAGDQAGVIVALEAQDRTVVGQPGDHARAWACLIALWPAGCPGRSRSRRPSPPCMSRRDRARPTGMQIVLLYDSLLRMEPSPVVQAEPRGRAGRSRGCPRRRCAT